jgi:DNA mismatch repair ATPase MutS
LIGEVDAAIAVASFMQRHPAHCRPIITDEARMGIADGYHLLLIHPVPISIPLDRRSAVICGANMAETLEFIDGVGPFQI